MEIGGTSRYRPSHAQLMCSSHSNSVGCINSAGKIETNNDLIDNEKLPSFAKDGLCYYIEFQYNIIIGITRLGMLFIYDFEHDSKCSIQLTTDREPSFMRLIENMLYISGDNYDCLQCINLSQTNELTLVNTDISNVHLFETNETDGAILYTNGNIKLMVTQENMKIKDIFVGIAIRMAITKNHVIYETADGCRYYYNITTENTVKVPSTMISDKISGGMEKIIVLFIDNTISLIDPNTPEMFIDIDTSALSENNLTIVDVEATANEFVVVTSDSNCHIINSNTLDLAPLHIKPNLIPFIQTMDNPDYNNLDKPKEMNPISFVLQWDDGTEMSDAIKSRIREALYTMNNYTEDISKEELMPLYEWLRRRGVCSFLSATCYIENLRNGVTEESFIPCSFVPSTTLRLNQLNPFERFKRLYDVKDQADITITSQCEYPLVKYKAHGWIIAGSRRMFRAMFHGGFAEAQSKHIKFQFKLGKGFEAFLKFVYTECYCITKEELELAYPYIIYFGEGDPPVFIENYRTMCKNSYNLELEPKSTVLKIFDI